MEHSITLMSTNDFSIYKYKKKNIKKKSMFFHLFEYTVIFRVVVTTMVNF